MIKKNFKKFLILTLLLFTAITLLSVLSLYFANAFEITTKLFASSGVSFTTEYNLNNETCTLLTAKRENAYADYKEKISGAFSVDFSFFGEDKTGNEVSFVFADDKNVIELKVVSNSKYNEFSVSYNGQRYGIYYKDDNNSGLTTQMNKSGYYTQISGGDKINISFSVNTMEFYANNKLVWNFTKLYNDGALGPIIDGFEQYSVKIVFNKINGESSSVALYSLCGQKLNEKYIKYDSSIPTIYSNIKLNAIRNQEYKIGKPVVYDITDKDLSAEDVFIEVTYQNGDKIVNQKYYDNISFIPQKTGEYKIVYSVKDNSGNEGSATFTVNAFEKTPTSSIALSSALQNGTIGVGGTVKIPSATIKNDIFLIDTKYTAKVKIVKDDMVYNGVADEDYLYTFSENGNYKIVYYVDEYGFIDEIKVAEIDVNASTPTFTYLPINDYYSVGDIITIPSELTAKLGDRTVNADLTVTFPDGGEYSVSKNIAFTESGLYSFNLYAEIDGVRYVDKKSTNVEIKPENLFNGVVGASLQEYPYYSSVNGLLLNLVANTPSVYNKDIDLTNFTKDDSLIDLLAVSPVQGQVIYNKLYITFRDVSDYSNYITVFVNGKLELSDSYVSVKTEKGVYAGLSEGVISTDGQVIRHSFASSKITGFDPIDCLVSIRFDYQAKKLYVKNYNGEYVVFADFNNPDFIKQVGEFSGFQNGTARIEVSFDYLINGESIWYDPAYYFNSAKVLITKLAGYEYGDLLIQDSCGPQINVDVPLTVPKAKVDTEYRLFDASGFDLISGNCAVNTQVIYNYGSGSSVNCNIVNGKFIPKYAGDYTLIYTSTDNAGNISNKLVVVTAYDEDLPELILSVEEDIEEHLQGIESEIKTVNIVGGTGGRYFTKVTLLDENNNEIEVINNKFIPTVSGIYKVVWEVEDYIGNKKSLSYNIVIKDNNEPILDKVISIVPIMTVGQSHKIERFYANDYSEYPVKSIEAEVYVKYPSEGSYSKINVDNFIPDSNKVSHGDDLSFKFVFAGKKQTVEKYANCKVAKINTKDGQIDVSDYFVTDNVQITLDSYMRLKIQNGSSFIFGKNILASAFGVSATLRTNNFSRIVFTLTDSEQADISVKLNIVTKSNNYYANINGGTDFLVADAAVGRLLDISYKKSLQSIVITTNTTSSSGNTSFLSIKTDSNGKAFSGFPSGKVFFNVEFYTTSVDAIFDITSIGNQNLSNEREDFVGPIIDVNGECSGSVYIGEDFVIPSAIAEDVLSYAKEVTVTVKYPNSDNTVTAVDGTILKDAKANKDYIVRLTSAGRYTVSYSCVDENGRKARFVSRPLTVNAKDDEANFEISLEDGKTVPTSVRVGETIVLPTATVNSKTEVKISIACFSQIGTPITIKNNMFTPPKEGVYVIKYIAYNNQGLYTYKEYQIVAK